MTCVSTLRVSVCPQRRHSKAFSAARSLAVATMFIPHFGQIGRHG
jgi:hypothetical protein